MPRFGTVPGGGWSEKQESMSETDYDSLLHDPMLKAFIDGSPDAMCIRDRERLERVDRTALLDAIDWALRRK